jgi:hypothetical protein
VQAKVIALDDDALVGDPSTELSRTSAKSLLNTTSPREEKVLFILRGREWRADSGGIEQSRTSIMSLARSARRMVAELRAASRAALDHHAPMWILKTLVSAMGTLNNLRPDSSEEEIVAAVERAESALRDWSSWRPSK